MSGTIFSNLPNDLIMNIIKINTTNMTAERQEIKNKLNKCIKFLELVPFHYSPVYVPEYHKDKPIFYKVANQYWEARKVEEDNGFNEEYETYDTDEDDY
tara:strand:+ start:193 stop:489 length:297 start_codon:yes stop_codon:yes gene_type:complete